MIKKLKNSDDAIKNLIIFFVITGAVGLGTGLYDTVFANYLKEVYLISDLQRGLIEGPRELPGFLCLFIISALASLGDIRIAFFAQILSVIGMVFLGFFTPPLAIMLIALFLFSSGQHIYMPLADSIFISLNPDENKVGKRMGQYKSTDTAFRLLAAIIAFLGFRYGVLSFQAEIKTVFLISAVSLLVAAILFFILMRRRDEKIIQRKFSLNFSSDYKYYYILAAVHGAQKQIMLVFGPWVLISMLNQPTDSMALLAIIGSFVGIFFLRALGKWIDRFGIKKLLYVDALSFIVVYFLYGLIAWGLDINFLPSQGWPIIVVSSMFVLDRMSMNMGMVRVLYMKSIAKKPEDITSALSTGISLDHIITIGFAALGGLIWTTFGPQYVFFSTALLSFINVYIAGKVEIPESSSEN